VCQPRVVGKIADLVAAILVVDGSSMSITTTAV